MKNYQAILFIITIGISSCNYVTNEHQVDNTKPMYGEVIKNEEYKKADEDFKNECLEKWKTIDSSVSIVVNDAWNYFYHNDLKASMKRFNQVWLLNPDFSDSYFGFAALMDMKGNKIESERFYKMGLEKDTKKERALICYRRIADCKEQLQDINGTFDAYIKISEINPTNAFALKKIGYFQMQKGNTEDALKAYGKAIELDSTDAVTYNNRAYLYQMNENYKNAMIDYSKAIELDPKYIDAYVNRGIVENIENNYDAAKKDFEICVQLDSRSGELRRILGLIKLSLKDKLGACKDFELAKHLGDTQAAQLIEQNCK